MQQHYHIDLGEPGLLERRSGRWLSLRILGLLSIESRLRLELFPPETPKPGGEPG